MSHTKPPTVTTLIARHDWIACVEPELIDVEAAADAAAAASAALLLPGTFVIKHPLSRGAAMYATSKTVDGTVREDLHRLAAKAAEFASRAARALVQPLDFHLPDPGMSFRNVIALLTHVGRSELLPRWKSEEVDDDLLADVDHENFTILGLTDQQARVAIAFRTGGFRAPPSPAAVPSAAPDSAYAHVLLLLRHIGRTELLSGG